MSCFGLFGEFRNYTGHFFLNGHFASGYRLGEFWHIYLWSDWFDLSRTIRDLDPVWTLPRVVKDEVWAMALGALTLQSSFLMGYYACRRYFPMLFRGNLSTKSIGYGRAFINALASLFAPFH